MIGSDGEGNLHIGIDWVKILATALVSSLMAGALAYFTTLAGSSDKIQKQVDGISNRLEIVQATAGANRSIIEAHSAALGALKDGQNALESKAAEFARGMMERLSAKMDQQEQARASRSDVIDDRMADFARGLAVLTERTNIIGVNQSQIQDLMRAILEGRGPRSPAGPGLGSGPYGRSKEP